MASKYSPHIKEFIDWYWKRFYTSPTIRDIKDHLDGLPISGGNVSTSNVSYALENDLGYEKKAAREVGLSRQIIPNWVKKSITEAKIE